jgi:hypothetical protein
VPPQAAHVPFEQLAPEPVQYANAPTAPASPPPQQAWPTAPHGPPEAVEQLPLLQVPEMPVPVQASPEPIQVEPVVPKTQQPPPLQLLPAQQGWPEAPHATAPPPAPPVAVAPPVAPLVVLPPEPTAPPVPPLDLLLLQPTPSAPAMTASTMIRASMLFFTLSVLVDRCRALHQIFVARRPLECGLSAL